MICTECNGTGLDSGGALCPACGGTPDSDERERLAALAPPSAEFVAPGPELGVLISAGAPDEAEPEAES